MKDALVQTVTSITIALIGLAASYAILLIKKAKQKIEEETDKIADEKQRALVKDALENLNTIAAKTVTQIEQTTAKALRESVKDGKTDRNELLALANQAYNEILSTMKPEYVELLQKELGNFNKYIKDTIEEKVFELKTLGGCSYN